MDALINAYYDLQDQNISVVDLYIYHLLSNDDRSIDLSNKELEQIIDKVHHLLYTYYNLRLEDIVERVLEGEDDAWDLY